MKRRRTKPKEQPKLLAIDVDFTLTKDPMIQFSGSLAELNRAMWKIIEQYEQNPKALFDRMVKDTESGHLVRIIKYALQNNISVSLVTHNTSIDYCKFCLAMLGLSSREIAQVHIRYRLFKEDKGKAKYINDEIAFHNRRLGRPLNSEFDVTFLDDEPDNCLEVDAAGHTAVLAEHELVTKGRSFEVTYPYLDILQAFLSIDDDDLSSMAPSAMHRRIAIAKGVILSKSKAEEKHRNELEISSISFAPSSATSLLNSLNHGSAVITVASSTGLSSQHLTSTDGMSITEVAACTTLAMWSVVRDHAGERSISR
jgi:hypothetical protein